MDDEDFKFDVVIGNPPYQKSGESRDEPIYHHFYEIARKIAKRYCMISPARFLFNAGQTPKEWNEKMLNDEHLKVLFYEQNSANVFANTDIKGGVAIVYRDDEQVFGSIGTFTQYEELNSITVKISKVCSVFFSDIVNPQGLYRFSEQFFIDFPHAEKLQGKGTKIKLFQNHSRKWILYFTMKKLMMMKYACWD